MSNEVAKVWFEEVKRLEIGQALFFRVANKAEQTKLANAFEKECKYYASLDPIHASQIFINKVLKNMKQYVVVERKYRSPYTAFFKDTNGEMSKITIDPERRRQLQLMIRDKKSRLEIEEAMNGLTETEIEEFFISEGKE